MFRCSQQCRGSFGGYLVVTFLPLGNYFRNTSRSLGEYLVERTSAMDSICGLFFVPHTMKEKFGDNELIRPPNYGS